MEAAKSGKSVVSLMADFNAAQKAEEQRFQVCLHYHITYPASTGQGLTSEHWPLSWHYQLLHSMGNSACYSVSQGVCASVEAQHLRASAQGPCKGFGR